MHFNETDSQGCRSSLLVFPNNPAPTVEYGIEYIVFLLITENGFKN